MNIKCNPFYQNKWLHIIHSRFICKWILIFTLANYYTGVCHFDPNKWVWPNLLMLNGKKNSILVVFLFFLCRLYFFSSPEQEVLRKVLWSVVVCCPSLCLFVCPQFLAHLCTTRSRGAFRVVLCQLSIVNNFFKHLPNRWANLDQTLQECILGGRL